MRVGIRLNAVLWAGFAAGVLVTAAAAGDVPGLDWLLNMGLVLAIGCPAAIAVRAWRGNTPATSVQAQMLSWIMENASRSQENKADIAVMRAALITMCESAGKPLPPALEDGEQTQPLLRVVGGRGG